MSLLIENRPNASVQLGAIFEAFPDLLFDLDSGGRILDYRGSELTLLNLSPKALLNRHIQDILPLEIGEEFQKAVEQASFN
jgi:PAS domain-containing protein